MRINRVNEHEMNIVAVALRQRVGVIDVLLVDRSCKAPEFDENRLRRQQCRERDVVRAIRCAESERGRDGARAEAEANVAAPAHRFANVYVGIGAEGRRAIGEIEAVRRSERGAR